MDTGCARPVVTATVRLRDQIVRGKLRSVLRKLTIAVFWSLSPLRSPSMPDGAFMTESEVQDFVVGLGARVSTELGLGLDQATLRRIACAVIAAADEGDPA